MKRILYLTCFIALFLGSCQKEELQTFNTDNSVYFSTAAAGTSLDSMMLSFAYSTPLVSDSVIKVVVKTMGAPANTDRPVKVVAGTSSTAITGVHYEFPEEFRIRAGRVTDTLKVRLKRTAEMKSKAYVLYLDLVPNDFFSTHMQFKTLNTNPRRNVSMVSFKVVFSDILIQPPGWNLSYFGVFSLKKMLLMTELLGVKAEDLPGLNVNTRTYYGLYMQRYLNEKALAGEAIYEDNNALMVMGSFVQ